jgi:hypothetical protein
VEVMVFVCLFSSSVWRFGANDDVIMRAHAPLIRALVKSLSSFSEFT